MNRIETTSLRRYVEITPSLTLKKNFISRGHYMTEELLVHAGINHQLCLYLSFPDLPLSGYSLRNTGNRGIEAIHGIFRGGSSSLPITSANLSFQRFLSRMNKTLQVHEHTLKHIEGNTIVASKKKRLTSVARQVPMKCTQNSVHLAISDLAPQMAAALKN